MIVSLRHLCYLSLAGALFAFPAQGSSVGIEPFPVRNMNPFALIFGVPSASSTQQLAADEIALQVTADVANNSIKDSSNDERVRLDGETYRLGLLWKWGVTSDWEVGVELPLLTHGGGWMDGLIENWHDIFGLPNSDRKDWPRNHLIYRYESRDGERLLISRKMSGVGDLILSLSHRLDPETLNGGDFILHGSLKLPTGDSDRLLGSGAADLAFWVSGAGQRLFWDWPLNIYGQGGLLLKGKADLLRDRQRDLVLFGTLGIGWHWNEWLDLKVQVDGHTSHYKSALDQLGGAAMMLTFGGSIHLDNEGRRIDIAIGENLTTDSVPDFMVNLAYVQRLDLFGSSAQ